MKRTALVIILVVWAALGSAQQPFSAKQSTKEVTEVCNAVAKWQMDNQHKVKHKPLDWTNGTLYRGMVEWAKMRGDTAIYNFVVNIGKENFWRPWERPWHADDICVGQAFIELSQIYSDPRMLRPTMERAYWVAGHPSQAPVSKKDPKGKDERWSWCDVLFMAPPVYASLYTITGEKCYLDYMVSEYKICTDSLYDKQEKLFYRDAIRIPLREPNGAKQFWARGNGWVFGGLPLVIQNLPENEPSRKYFIELFQKLATSVLRTQDKEGSWHSSLLDPGSYPQPENSSSAFFCYGLLWGLNNGYLSGKEYRNAADKAWKALVSYVHPDGKLGYVQPVGAAPKATGFESTDVYGVGAFLLAGSEMYKMTGGKPSEYRPAPPKLRSSR